LLVTPHPRSLYTAEKRMRTNQEKMKRYTRRRRRRSREKKKKRKRNTKAKRRKNDGPDAMYKQKSTKESS